MSADARPISPTRFAAAITELPISSLYAKAAELRNSMAHLSSSNSQLTEFAAQGDKDCADAIRENEEVLQRMEQRILLLQYEVEVNRSLKWVEEGGEHEVVKNTSETEDREVGHTNGTGSEQSQSTPQQATGETSGRLTDEELRRRLAERMAGENGDDAEGVYL